MRPRAAADGLLAQPLGHDGLVERPEVRVLGRFGRTGNSSTLSPATTVSVTGFGDGQAHGQYVGEKRQPQDGWRPGRVRRSRPARSSPRSPGWARAAAGARGCQGGVRLKTCVVTSRDAPPGATSSSRAATSASGRSLAKRSVSRWAAEDLEPLGQRRRGEAERLALRRRWSGAKSLGWLCRRTRRRRWRRRAGREDAEAAAVRAVRGRRLRVRRPAAGVTQHAVGVQPEPPGSRRDDGHTSSAAQRPRHLVQPRLRRRPVLHPDAEHGLVHHAGVLVLQPVVPPAQRFLEEADGGPGVT